MAARAKRERGVDPSPRELQAEAEEPPLDEATNLVIRCWNHLQTCRDIGMTLGPIPWDRIVAWAGVAGLDREATQLLVLVVMKLDADHLAAIAAKQRQREA